MLDESTELHPAGLYQGDESHGRGGVSDDGDGLA